MAGLYHLEQEGPEIREVQGQRDLSLADVAQVVARLSGRPELQVAHAINSGHTRARQPRTARTTTPTSIEQFVTATLLPALGRS
ncbi:hypothetical protein [Amycolatopsis saalfeldensis]|uniref:Uncharacterized protein n=1 Tax=Amycolatopsis saalfeldensis TaxID=394193 RepID=A0A1H8YED6_9PSEU|nr:hypothetical protein [Amycolatopsis saalfeldensis]SEP50442.1 hypothetical protein SAMN04489732_114145 [Amycolatopsis saalfeldensis]